MYLKKKLGIALIGIMLISVLLITGCSQRGDGRDEPEQNETAELTGSLTIAGSTSIQPFSEMLAEEFMVKNPQVQINVQGGGSSQGIRAVASGAADIGAVSRKINDEEMTENQDLIPIQIAIDGVAVVVNPANSVSDLSVEDIKNIYLGNITDWQDVGGTDAAITVVTREEASGTRDCFVDTVMNKEEITPSAIVQNSNGAVRTTVAGDENAIGYVSLAMLNEQIKALKIDGVDASADNIRNGQYTIERPFTYITNGEATGVARAFIDYVLNEEGQAIIMEEGAISLSRQ